MILLDFIKNNKDSWEDILSQEPYNIKIKTEGKYSLLMYNQLSSDMSLPLVQKCRGSIINNETITYVCKSFDKFFNYGESEASEIDWESARVQVKHDGSIIKVFYDDEWKVSTNGTINASEATMENDFLNFRELFDMASSNLDFSKLDKNKTYIFELTSPLNRVVVNYTEHKIYHIGTIDNITLIESNDDIGVEKPKEVTNLSLNEVLAIVGAMSHEEEGFVVVDKYWNRVKIKSQEYVRVHRLYSNVMTKKRALEIIKMNEQSEFLVYFPQYKDLFEKMESAYDTLIEDITEELRACMKFNNKKEFAMENKDCEFRDFLFKTYDGRYVKQWVDSLHVDKLIEMLEDRM